VEKIIDKVRKLLALARDKGASENEAATALAMAQKLIIEHDIKNVEEAVTVHAIRGQWMGVKLGDKWHKFLAHAVAELFNCRFVSNGVGDIQFVGKPENIEVCELTMKWVVEQVEALYKEGLATFKRQLGGLDQRTRGNFRQTFKEACALRVYRRAKEIVATARNVIPDHMALVVIDQSRAAASDLIRHLPRGRAASAKAGFGTGAGRSAGDRVNLQRGVR